MRKNYSELVEFGIDEQNKPPIYSNAIKTNWDESICKNSELNSRIIFSGNNFLCWDVSNSPYCLFLDSTFLHVKYSGGNNRRSKHADEYPVTLVSNSYLPAAGFYFEIKICDIKRGVSIGLIPNNDVGLSRSNHGWCQGSYVVTGLGRKAKYENRAVTEISISHLQIGDLIDVNDNVRRWEPAVIQAINGSRILIHYLGLFHIYNLFLI